MSNVLARWWRARRARAARIGAQLAADDAVMPSRLDAMDRWTPAMLERLANAMEVEDRLARQATELPRQRAASD